MIDMLVKNQFHLMTAIESGRLRLHFQPRVRISNGVRVVGVEGLLRWSADGVSWCPIPAWEEFTPLDFELLWSWNLIQTKELFVRRRSVGWSPSNRASNFFVSLNLHCSQLSSTAWAEEAIETIEDADLPGDCIEVELTEVTQEGTTKRFEDALTLLKAAGIRISLDDFPEGSSSFERLARFRFDKVKIDRKMVPQMADSPYMWARRRQILEDLVHMIHHAGAEVVVEGIEHRSQFQYLADIGASEWQGYYWGMPMALEKLLCDA